MSQNPASCISPNAQSCLPPVRRMRRDLQHIQLTEANVLLYLMQRRAQRRVVLNREVCQKPVPASLPVFSRTAGTTFAAHSATLMQEGNEGNSRYDRSAQVQKQSQEAVNAADNWLTSQLGVLVESKPSCSGSSLAAHALLLAVISMGRTRNFANVIVIVVVNLWRVWTPPGAFSEHLKLIFSLGGRGHAPRPP